METSDIGIFSLALFALFLLPFFVLSLKLKLDVIKQALWASLRMIVQLSFVGIYLKYIFEYNNPLINILYILIMIIVATLSVIKTTGLNLKTMIIPVFISILVPHALMLFFFNGAVVQVDNLFEAKYLVTIGGMLLGNCLSGNIIALDRFFSGIKDNEKVYIYSISLGASRYQALFPSLQNSIKASINPTIASMATIGLVALPGMMTGQILGGSSPAMAIRYQIAIMLAIFFTQLFSVTMSVFLSIRTGFDDFDMLKKSLFRS